MIYDNILLKEKRALEPEEIYLSWLEDTWSVFVGFWKGQCQDLWKFHEIHISTKRSTDPLVVFALKDWLATPISFSNIFQQIRTVRIKNLEWPATPLRKIDVPEKEESFDFEQGSDTLKVSFPIIVEIWDCHRFIVFDSKAFFVTPCNAHFVAKKPRSFTTCPSNKAGIWGLLLWRCRHLGGMTHDHDDLVNDSLQSQMSHKKHQKNMGDTWLRCIPILLEPQTMYLL